MAIKEIFESNTDKINLATLLLSELSDREGQYVWKKLTAKNGTFIELVVSDASDAYPDGGTQDGYYYKKVSDTALNSVLYSGANPLTIGESGATIAAGTLLDAALQILNGVEAGLTAEDFGYSKMSVSKLVFASDTAVIGSKISHGLQEKPSLVIVYAASELATAYGLAMFITSDKWQLNADSTTLNGTVFTAQPDALNNSPSPVRPSYTSYTSSSIEFVDGLSSYAVFAAGVTYVCAVFA